MTVSPVQLADSLAGPGHPCYVIAEIGINHNGDLDLARKLISVAAAADCDAVKFQKRTVADVYSPLELARPRPNPFGSTNGDLKRGLEFGRIEYLAVHEFCRASGLAWAASCWDRYSVDFIERFDPPFYKIASACLTDDDLLRYTRSTGRPIVLSTGMSTLDEIDHAVEVLGTNELLILHCTSTYPTSNDELNLSCIPALQARYGVPVGYSGHEQGIATSVAAVALGACMLERHITLDRTLWGSDQAASLEPPGLKRLVRDIKAVEAALGDGAKRVYDSELPVKKKAEACVTDTELHVLSPPDAAQPPEPRPLSPQVQAAVMFFDGESVASIAAKLGHSLTSDDVEHLLRAHLQAITRQAQALLTNCKQLTQRFHDAHKEHAEPTLDPQTDFERIYRDAKSDLYFEAAQRLQSVVDAAWEARLK